MSIEATGLFGEPLERLKALLAPLAAVQTFLGIDPEDDPEDRLEAAEAAIQLWDGDPGAAPLILIALAEDWKEESVQAGGPFSYVPSYSLNVLFERAVPEVYRTRNSADAIVEFMNLVGPCITELKEQVGRDGGLAIHEIGFATRPMRTGEELNEHDDPLTGDDRCYVGIRLECGI